MRVLVTGGREYDNQVRLWAALDTILGRSPVLTIVHGGARGADRAAAGWVADQLRGAPGCQVSEEVYPADWKHFGKSAGVIRNTEMLATGIDLGVVCNGGPGTVDMKRKLERAGVPIIYPDMPWRAGVLAIMTADMPRGDAEARTMTMEEINEETLQLTMQLLRP